MSNCNDVIITEVLESDIVLSVVSEVDVIESVEQGPQGIQGIPGPAAVLGPDDNYVTDAEKVKLSNLSGNNSGDAAPNTTSNTYADGKVADAITNGITTVAPSQNAVFDALTSKQNTLVSATNIKTINGSSILGAGDLVIVGGGGGSVAVKDEGTTLTATATSFDFVGAGVTATNTGDSVTVAITGSYAPVLGADDNYVTDAEKTKLSNLAGINTGDQDLSEILALGDNRVFAFQLITLNGLSHAAIISEINELSNIFIAFSSVSGWMQSEDFYNWRPIDAFPSYTFAEGCTLTTGNTRYYATKTSGNIIYSGVIATGKTSGQENQDCSAAGLGGTGVTLSGPTLFLDDYIVWNNGYIIQLGFAYDPGDPGTIGYIPAGIPYPGVPGQKLIYRLSKADGLIFYSMGTNTNVFTILKVTTTISITYQVTLPLTFINPRWVKLGDTILVYEFYEVGVIKKACVINLVTPITATAQDVTSSFPNIDIYAAYPIIISNDNYFMLFGNEIGNPKAYISYSRDGKTWSKNKDNSGVLKQATQIQPTSVGFIGQADSGGMHVTVPGNRVKLLTNWQNSQRYGSFSRISTGQVYNTDGFPVTEPPKVVATTTSAGATLTIAKNVVSYLVNPATTTATQTIRLPTYPYNGQAVTISFGGTITTGVVVTNLTIVPDVEIPGKTIVGKPYIQGVSGESVRYVFQSPSTWIRN